MTTVISATELKNNVSQVLNEVAFKDKVTIVKRHGKPAVVIMSAREYDGWNETNEILADPGLMKAIKQGEKDVKMGRVKDWEEVKKELGWD